MWIYFVTKMFMTCVNKKMKFKNILHFLMPFSSLSNSPYYISEFSLFLHYQLPCFQYQILPCSTCKFLLCSILNKADEKLSEKIRAYIILMVVCSVCWDMVSKSNGIAVADIDDEAFDDKQTGFIKWHSNEPSASDT